MSDGRWDGRIILIDGELAFCTQHQYEGGYGRISNFMHYRLVQSDGSLGKDRTCYDNNTHRIAFPKGIYEAITIIREKTEPLHSKCKYKKARCKSCNSTATHYTLKGNYFCCKCVPKGRE